MTGARRTRLSDRSGAIKEMAADDASDADALDDQDSRNLARDARVSSDKAAGTVSRHAVSIERNCGRAPRCRLIAVWSLCSRRRSCF
jgi:hypothetical protein